MEEMDIPDVTAFVCLLYGSRKSSFHLLIQENLWILSITESSSHFFMYLLLTGLDLAENISRSIHHTSLTGQTIYPAHRMYCVLIIGDDAHLN